MRIVFFFLLFAGVVLFSGCDKEDAVMNEDILSGTWIKGSSTGDTLRFFKKNEKNILAYNLSFNAAFYALQEVEYIYQNGKPAIKNFRAAPGDFFIIQSFEWLQPGKEFKFHGIELFPFMASTLVYFTYHRIQ